MKLTRTREFVVNMGNYESFRTSATVELYDPMITHITDLEQEAEKILDEALKQDLLDAARLSDVRNTYVLTWNEEKYGNNKN